MGSFKYSCLNKVDMSNIVIAGFIPTEYVGGIDLAAIIDEAPPDMKMNITRKSAWFPTNAFYLSNNRFSFQYHDNLHGADHYVFLQFHNVSPNMPVQIYGHFQDIQDPSTAHSRLLLLAKYVEESPGSYRSHNHAVKREPSDDWDEPLGNQQWFLHADGLLGRFAEKYDLAARHREVFNSIPSGEPKLLPRAKDYELK